MEPFKNHLNKSILGIFNFCVLQIDSGDKKKKNKKGSGGFKVGKRKVKTKLSALAKAKLAQAMEVDK